MILVMVDAGSKYLDAVPMRNANVTETVRALRTLMATHGLVDTAVSDNGSVFTSYEFAKFLKRNGIRHYTHRRIHRAVMACAKEWYRLLRLELKS
jgi:transposase InsO family protein